MLNDAFWPEHFDALMTAAERDPGFRILQRVSVRGITIYECLLADEATGDEREEGPMGRAG
jgi:hypothetical protein